MSRTPSTETSGSSRAWRRWIAAIVLLVFFGALMWTVINPYRGQRFEKVPHGDHVHFVPKDRNEEVPMSRFPTQRPESDERITPEGEVVPSRDAGGAP